MRRSLLGTLSALALITAVPTANGAPIGPMHTTAPLPGSCSWGAPSDPDAVNAAYPDTNATYWSARYAAIPGTKLVVHGTYPAARYFSFHVYHPGGVPLDSIYDAQIRPDTGARNPFRAAVPKGRPEQYTVTVEFAAKPAHPAPNTIYAGQTNVDGAPNPGGLLMLRVYVPTNSKDPAGRVPLPRITTETDSGTVITDDAACSNSLPKTGGIVNQELTTNSFPAGAPPTGATQQPTWSRAFGNPYAGAFGNQQNAYLTATISRRFGNLVVIHAKAPTFANTRAGVPAYARRDLRYWSICQNSNSTRVNACAADFQAPQVKGDYTYVISDPDQRPSNADAKHGVVWLPWGAADATAVLIYRNMLVSAGFTHAVQAIRQSDDPQKVMGAYFPTARYCTKAEFEAGGWKACFYKQSG